ncbi:hypothetical protein GP476_00105 (plasmid) [Aeromonas dhakensis]|uniref:hypothetical protein n=1 Tax=Aeromonas dhakensis TaxID=196024 RepID=UPI0021B2A65A|nr:hypothetical protein [Aeromonas dhakensis]UXB09955.1 hypothetical protein GP476_00105 [Aeromonas dhakensis]
MTKQFKGKYDWQLMAWWIAVGYMLLYHTWALASPSVPVREIAVPVMTTQERVAELPSRQPVLTLNAEPLWPGEGVDGCQLVTLSVDALATWQEHERDDMRINTLLCHVWL